MERKLTKNNGVVFITVTMIIMIMMVLTISIISLNVSQTVVSSSEVDNAKCELLLEGYRAMLDSNPNACRNAGDCRQTLNGKTFEVLITAPVTGTGEVTLTCRPI